MTTLFALVSSERSLEEEDNKIIEVFNGIYDLARFINDNYEDVNNEAIMIESIFSNDDKIFKIGYPVAVEDFLTSNGYKRKVSYIRE